MNIETHYIKHVIAVAILLFCFGKHASAQEENRLQNVNIASPNAASLGKVADIPVSYHTGTPSIEIPIYTVQAGPLQMPISLSYHASGLKVMEQSSWVGAGWALNAGGVITRTVRGHADEKAFADTYYLQDQGYYSYLYAPNSTSVKPILDYVAIAGGVKDTEPDLFFFNFNGYSGKFYFRADKTPVIVPQQDIRITPKFCPEGATNCNPTNEKLYGFIITTPDGVKYYFGIDVDNPVSNPPVERVLPYSFTLGSDLSNLKIISSWYLYRVESPDSRFTINLNYEKEEYSTYGLSLYPVLNGNGGMNLSKTYFFGQRLSSITFTNGSVTFLADTAPRQDLSGANTTYASNDYDNTTDPYPAKGLRRIEISNATGFRAFDFDKSYFVDNHSLVGSYGTTAFNAETTFNLHTDKKRLKLDKVTEKSFDGTVVKPPHIFTYYDEANVPRTLSLAQDHWGFYNGATGNATLVPNTSTDGGWIFSENGANREASFPNMRAGALQKITYPTGGTSEFTYGAHQVFVNKKYYTIDQSWQINAVGANPQSVIYPITVGTQTMFKYRVRYVNGGDGSVQFGSTTHGDDNWNWQLILKQPGTHQFYCTASGGNGSHQGIEAELVQLNQYTNAETVLVGGLRIATLKTSDGSGVNDIIQTFDYTNNNGQNQGILFSRPSYIGIIRNDRLMQSGIAHGYEVGGAYEVSGSNGCNQTDAIAALLPDGSTEPIILNPAYYVSPSSLHPMRTIQGGHFGYNQVKVIQSDGGYTIYQYKLEPNVVEDVCVRAIDKAYCDPAAPNFPGAPEPFDPSRGELRGTYVFNAANTMLKSTQLETVYTPEAIGVHGLIVKNLTTGGGATAATEYEVKTYKKTKSTALEFIYNTEEPAQAPIGTVTETFWGSNYHNLESKSVLSEVTSGDMISNVVKGRVLNEKRSSYVADLTTSACDPDYSWNTTYASYYAIISANYYETVSNELCSKVCKFEAWQHFTRLTNELRKVYVTSKTSYETSKDQCLTDKANAAEPELKALLDLKIRNQLDPVIETSAWRDGKFLQSAYTTFQDVSSNRVDISPTKYETIQTNTPLLSADFSPSSNNGSVVNKDSKYVLEETYKYANGNIAEAIPKNGVVTSYIWGYNNTLPIVKAVGVSYATLNAAYVAVSGNLSAIRNQTSLANAMVTTYTHDPLIGMTSMTDPNGITTTYDYDKLGRLKDIKDKDSNVVQKLQYHYKGN